MFYKVLKTFPLSRDGVKIKDVQKGSTVHIPEDLVEGLAAAGYIDLGSETRTHPDLDKKIEPELDNKIEPTEPNNKIEPTEPDKKADDDPIAALVEPDKRPSKDEAKPVTKKA